MNNSIKRRISICKLLVKVEEHSKYAESCGIVDKSYRRELTISQKAS